ncbi:MAG TPA: carboxypeptidase regulatory-like domain-containing protein [Thermoplasmata archaeon]|nr:carboxypeptidase regulatory-like domain-containing protein [Thermoplasmata archaeon]
MERSGTILLVGLILIGLTLSTVPAESDAGRLTTLKISPANVVLAIGSSVVFTAIPLDELGQTVSGATVTWELKDPVTLAVTLEGSGSSVTITGKSQGYSTLFARASADGASVSGVATIAIGQDLMRNQTAVYPKHAVLVFPTDAMGLSPGQAIDFSAQYYDPSGRPAHFAPGGGFSWKMLFALGDAGTVDASGRFVAGLGGLGLVSAQTSDGATSVSGAAFVSVSAGGGWNAVPQLDVSPGLVSLLRAGQSLDFEAVLKVQGQPVPATVTWSLPLSIWEPGTIDTSTGLFRGHRAGACLIEASTVYDRKTVRGYALLTVAYGKPSIFGRVTNSDGVPVAGATVTAVEIGGTESSTTTTDSDGAYSVEAIPGARTKVQVSTAEGSSSVEAVADANEAENRYDITVSGVVAGPPGIAQLWPWFLGGFGIVVTGTLAIALLLGGEVVFVAMLMLFVPLYARIKAEKMLDHFVRGRIFGLIQATPGLSYSDLRRLTGVGNGTLGYHLWCLEKTEYVFSRREGKLKAYYPKGFNAPDRGRMLSDPQQRIMEVVKLEPGVSQSDVARALGTTRQHVNFNVKHMERLGVMRVVREGGEALCYPADLTPSSPQPRPAVIAGPAPRDGSPSTPPTLR